MAVWICDTCAVEQADTTEPAVVCAVCDDDRQYVRPSGQRWTTMDELVAAGRDALVDEVEPGLYGITVAPRVGLGQRSLLVQTSEGNLLWDPIGYVDDSLEEAIRSIGGVAAIASSHPHMFGAQVAWGERFDAPVLVQEQDRGWVQREDPRIQTWGDSLEVVPGVTLHRIGGHFPGSAVAHLTGADGRGVLLTGDTVMCSPDQHWVSFMRSYPNLIPLSAAVVRRLADRVLALGFDRVYDNFAGQVPADAHPHVERSAERYVAWVSGEHDDLTGT